MKRVGILNYICLKYVCKEIFSLKIKTSQIQWNERLRPQKKEPEEEEEEKEAKMEAMKANLLLCPLNLQFFSRSIEAILIYISKWSLINNIKLSYATHTEFSEKLKISFPYNYISLDLLYILACWFFFLDRWALRVIRKYNVKHSERRCNREKIIQYAACKYIRKIYIQSKPSKY